MNKFCWFALGTAIGSLGTKLLIDHSEEIDIWISEKLGIESPSKMLLNTDKIKEGISNAFDKDDTGRDSNRTGSKTDRICLSNIIYKERYASDEVQSSKDSNETPEPIHVVANNDNTIDIGEFDDTKIYKNVVITKEPNNGDLSDYIEISGLDYLSAKKKGLECILMAYSPIRSGFVKGTMNDNADFVMDDDSDNYYMNDLVPYIGIEYTNQVYDACVNGLAERFPMYIFNKRDNLYICLRW